MEKFSVSSIHKSMEITALFALMAVLLLVSGCITISEPYGNGPNTGQICVKVDSDDSGAHALEIEAIGIGGPNAGQKVMNEQFIQGPLKQTAVCVTVIGDPNIQQWQITAKVTNQNETKKEDYARNKYTY